MYVLCGCMCCLEKTSPTLSACWNGKRSDRFDDLPRQRVIECSSHIWHICKWVLRTAGVTRQIYTTVFHDFASNQITTFALCVQLKLEVAHSLFLVVCFWLYGGCMEADASLCWNRSDRYFILYLCIYQVQRLARKWQLSPRWTSLCKCSTL